MEYYKSLGYSEDDYYQWGQENRDSMPVRVAGLAQTIAGFALIAATIPEEGASAGLATPLAIAQAAMAADMLATGMYMMASGEAVDTGFVTALVESGVVTRDQAVVLEIALLASLQNAAKHGSKLATEASKIKINNSVDDIIDAAARNSSVSQELQVGKRTILPGMNRPVRPVNPNYPPNEGVLNAMKSEEVLFMVQDQAEDCAEIAQKLLQTSGGNGKIIEVRPNQSGNLSLTQNGKTANDWYYHQVYTDGKYIYDPRLSSLPIPKGDWEMHIRALNPGGVTISSKIKN